MLRVYSRDIKGFPFEVQAMMVGRFINRPSKFYGSVYYNIDTDQKVFAPIGLHLVYRFIRWLQYGMTETNVVIMSSSRYSEIITAARVEGYKLGKVDAMNKQRIGMLKQ